MADIKTLKGFIRNSNGDIILPISRGELIFDASGNIALRSLVFKAEAAERDLATKLIKSGTGKYGLMTPEDLLDLHEALAKITIIEKEIGVGESDGTGDSLKKLILDLIDKVGYSKGEIIGLDTEGKNIVAATDTGIYQYINNKIINHLAQSDALKFKGTLGLGGNIVALPSENINNGDTYKVLSAGVYDGKNAKPGDLFIALYTPDSNEGEGTYTWDLVPSGNESETFIKVLNVIDGETIDKTLSGVINLVGTNGIGILYNEDTNTISISGLGELTSIQLLGIKDRLSALELTINGSLAEGTLGTPDYKPFTPGLIHKTAEIQEKINLGVTTWDQVVEQNIGEDGLPNGTLKNGDSLVKASAVYDVTVRLATHISEADGKYLLAETMELTALLSSDLKNYLSGTITN